MTYTVQLFNPQQASTAWVEIFPKVKAYLMGGNRLTLCIKKETRSSEQNARLWAMLSEVSKQVVWHGQKLSADDWKDVFTASLRRQRVVPGIDSGFVVLGQRTSKMTKEELSDLMELISAFGAQQGVTFND